MSDIKFPYCDHEQDVYHDDGENIAEDETHQMECYECEKSFVFLTCISIDYSPSKADCLNEGEHEWKPTNTVPRQYTKMSCTMCDERRSPTVEEIQAIVVGDKL